MAFRRTVSQTILCLVAVGAVACERSRPSTTLSRSALGGSFAIEGSVKASSGSLADGLFFDVSTEAPASIEVLTYESGDPLPVATTILSIDSGGEFSGLVTEGDTYRANVLDASGELTGAERLTAFGTDSTGVVAAFPSTIIGVPADRREMYTFAASPELLTIDGVIDPFPGQGAITSLEHAWIQTGRVVASGQVSVTATSSGDVVVDIDVPVFSVGCGYVVLLSRDSAGIPVQGSWTGSASTPSITYTSGSMDGGFLFSECPGGYDEAKFCKKILGRTLYPKKLGEASSATYDRNEWCIDCPKDEAAGAGADVPTDKIRIAPPREIYCSGAGITVANSGKVFVTCQERLNVPHDGFAARRARAEAEEGVQPDENLPTRTSGVEYKFSVFEAQSDSAGKDVHDLKWFQVVKGTITYKSPSGDGTVETTGGTHVWDDGSAGGGDATADHSYPYQGDGRSTANDWAGMSDAPAIPVPTTDAEAASLACSLGITGDAKSDWTEITMKWDFHTILVCCATDEVLSVYSWSVTVTIKKAGANSYSSSASGSGVTQGNDPPAGFEYSCD